MTIDKKTTGLDNDQLARNIWLAGLGVYRKSLDEAQNLEHKTSSLFDELVEQGREVEEKTRAKVEQNLDKANQEVENRVHDIFYRLSGFRPQQINDLNAKVDRLTDAVEQLAAKQ
ncbi:phasin family protein [Paraferrimonas sedimenticola]|uniref:Poly(Hydroxyalkanoate) granule-associated protein n=1 Tax=Paraferrimonas sedimenticola TaxID=375674 RepID=A0AA37RUI2_9GAMM|nr:phasin family protein [Paraferrimonas sedimenticola]GLP95885.1 hypothetical protein GCM10007895_11910 [Paraferrimonas sedimenticola]